MNDVSFYGEIRFFIYGRIPTGWMIADGSVLDITLFQPLYALLGTTYGGDGRKTFALPDLRGRVPIGFGTEKKETLTYTLGQRGGEESVTLKLDQMPAHTHDFRACTEVGTTGNADGAHVAALNTDDMPAKNIRYAFGTDAPSAADGQLTPMNEASIEPWADSTLPGTPATPHDNMQPFAVMCCCICVDGMWPERPD